jgi:hypothetical protein
MLSIVMGIINFSNLKLSKNIDSLRNNLAVIPFFYAFFTVKE